MGGDDSWFEWFVSRFEYNHYYIVAQMPLSLHLLGIFGEEGQHRRYMEPSYYYQLAWDRRRLQNNNRRKIEYVVVHDFKASMVGINRMSSRRIYRELY